MLSVTQSDSYLEIQPLSSVHYLYFKLDIFTKTLINFDAKGWDFIKCLAHRASDYWHKELMIYM